MSSSNNRQPSLSVGILGGGALGLSVAYRLAQAGARVTVLEKDSEVGGLASSFEVGGAHLEKFYHHLFRSDTTIIKLIEELGLSPKLTWLKPTTSNLIDGKIHKMDPVRLLTQPILPFADRLRFFFGLAYLKVDSNYHRFEGQTAEAWIKRWMGQRVYDVVWRPLLESKFGAHYQRIAMPWLWSRVYCRSLALGYLRGGFHQLYAALHERVRALGGDVQTGQTVESIESAENGRVRVIVNGEAREFDRVVCTLPTRLFMKLASGLPEDYRRRYDWGEYHGAHCVVLSLDRPLTDIYWLSVNDPGFPFLVLVEHANYVPPSDYAGERLVYLGNYLPMSDRRFGMSDEEILGLFLPYLAKINPSFDPSWVKRSWVFKAPFAQPIVTVDYHDHIPPHETPIPGLYLANMFQVYPQDRGQNYSIAMGFDVAERVLKDPVRFKDKVGQA
ncbi:MAG TPA: NAD(P)/FAD-dependent oxidoreductase [Chloroflexota bacterium]|nr:NAD(P)/FAD-dependent oxidoreductase [Chloroflexota bacterium]